MSRPKSKKPKHIVAELDVVRTRLFKTIDDLVDQAKPARLAERGLAKVSSAVQLIRMFNRR